MSNAKQGIPLCELGNVTTDTYWALDQVCLDSLYEGSEGYFL